MNETEILESARQIESATARAKFLDKACAGDTDLRARMELLLNESGERSGESSPFEATELADPDQQQDEDHGSDFGGETASTRLGNYRLIRPIGEGGMGSVWLAEQEEPVLRTVALKVIKAGMDTEAVIARFEAERQALARMDHPNIARVLDAGATETGRPFFVMELVQGIPVTKYCDSKCLTTEKRLELFCTICNAIQHAHQKGIIHRDIKPSNVLVMEVDGEAVVKVIDFGLAKATDTRLSEKSMFTQLGQILGTPTYMSPEQAAANPDIDTRTDVYSLGVLLYELLTGVTPIDIRSLRDAAYVEIQRVIREIEPPRMSARLSSLGEDSVVAAGNRGTDTRRLAQQVRGDLDIIAMKALEKDRDRRYDTPHSFASDVQRYIHREAIEARPASTWYRLQKFLARHRVTVVTAAIVAASLIIGTVVSVWQAIEANKAAIAEREANEKAQKRLAQVEKGAEILGTIFKDIDLRRIEGEGKTLDQVLGERLKDASAQLTNDALGDVEVTARLQGLLAESLYSLGHFEESIELLNKSCEARTKLLGADHPDTLTSRHNLAESYVLAGEYERAVAIHEDTLERSKKALGPNHVDTLSSMKDLGNAYVYNSDYDAGIPLLEEALRLFRETAGEEDQTTLTAINSLAVGYHYADKLDRALPLYEDALKLSRKVNGADHYDTMTGMNNLASCYYAIEEIEKALPLMQEVYELRKAKLGSEHPHTIISMTNLAVVLEGAGQRKEALPYFEESLAISESKNGPNHPGTLQRIRNLANCCRDLGDTDRAMQLYQEYVDRQAVKDGKDSLAYADALIYLGFNQVKLERWAEAEPVLQECLALRLKHLAEDDWRIASTKAQLGAALVGLNKLDEAEPFLVAGYEGQKAKENEIPASGRDGILQALERLILFYELRNADGDSDRVEQLKSERME